MYPACSERVPLRLLVRDERRFGVSGSEVPLPHRHWLGQLDLPPSHPRLVRGPQHRPGRTTTCVACPATILVSLEISRACHRLSKHGLALAALKSYVGHNAENLSPNSSLRSLHRRPPTVALRPCSCSVGRQSCPSPAPKVSGFLRILSCRLGRGNCSGA